jgi:acetylornithine deacetylase/succinyl-diaminopimelate desuccinylase-like protein
MLNRLVVLAVVLGLPSCTALRPGVAPTDPARMVESADVHRQLYALADDSMMGRRIATPGIAKAARFIAEEMRRAGLEPAGDSGFFQRVPMATRRVEVMGRDSTRRTIETLALLGSVAELDSVPPMRQRMDVNVIGMIRGTDPVLRDSAIVIGAHHDHIGVRSGATPDSIYNGADDDASGVVTVLQIAKALARSKPKRTMVFATFTGEEGGGTGSRRARSRSRADSARRG